MTRIGDVLAPRSVVKPFASIMAAGAVASAVVSWVTYFGLSPPHLERPKDQPSFFDARFPNPAELPLPSAGDSKLHAATGLPAQKLRVGGLKMSEPDEQPGMIAATVPLPRPRPASATLSPQLSEVAQSDDRTLLQRLSDAFRTRMTLASMTPQDDISTPALDHASLGYYGLTAVYDISAQAWRRLGLRL
jgi:hypothetical protein